MMKTIYTMPASDALGAMIEVYGDPENAWYEWRIIDGGRAMRTPQQMTSEQQIGLRQKLIESMRRQQSQQSLEQLLFDPAGFSGAH